MQIILNGMKNITICLTFLHSTHCNAVLVKMVREPVPKTKQPVAGDMNIMNWSRKT